MMKLNFLFFILLFRIPYLKLIRIKLIQLFIQIIYFILKILKVILFFYNNYCYFRYKIKPSFFQNENDSENSGYLLFKGGKILKDFP